LGACSLSSSSSDMICVAMSVILYWDEDSRQTGATTGASSSARASTRP
jgi:hypothetical protein